MKKFAFILLFLSASDLNASDTSKDSAFRKHPIDIKLNLANAPVAHGIPAPHLEFFLNKNSSLNFSFYYYELEFNRFPYVECKGASAAYRKYFNIFSNEKYKNFLAIGLDYMNRYSSTHNERTMTRTTRQGEYIPLRIEGGQKVNFNKFIFESSMGLRILNADDLFLIVNIGIGYRI